jgi:hypothetical protein
MESNDDQKERIIMDFGQTITLLGALAFVGLWLALRRRHKPLR